MLEVTRRHLSIQYEVNFLTQHWPWLDPLKPSLGEHTIDHPLMTYIRDPWEGKLKLGGLQGERPSYIITWWLSWKPCRCFVALGKMGTEICFSCTTLNAKYQSHYYCKVTLQSFQQMTDIRKLRRACWTSWQMKKLLFCVGPTGFGNRCTSCIIVAMAQKCNQDQQSQEPHDCLEMWQHRNYFLKPTATLWQASDIGSSFSPLRVRG